MISHKGLVHWEPGGVFKTMCEIDITFYPFDEQKCELNFGALSYHTSKMNLTNSSSKWLDLGIQLFVYDIVVLHYTFAQY